MCKTNFLKEIHFFKKKIMGIHRYPSKPVSRVHVWVWFGYELRVHPMGLVMSSYYSCPSTPVDIPICRKMSCLDNNKVIDVEELQDSLLKFLFKLVSWVKISLPRGLHRTTQIIWMFVFTSWCVSFDHHQYSKRAAPLLSPCEQITVRKNVVLANCYNLQERG